MILQVSPDASVLVRGAATLILVLHIGAGGLGLVSGAAALLFRKGSRLHRMAGNVFFVSMLTMSAIGASVAPFLPVPERGSVVGGVLTFYLVATSWATVKRKQGSIGRFEVGAFLVALGIVAAGAILVWMAASSPTGTLDGQPRAAFYLFVVVGAIAAVGDLELILRRGVSGARRIARHLWRMCFALFIAAASLFLGQQQVFPKSLRGSFLLLVPEIAVVGLLIFWLCRVLFTKAYKKADGQLAPMRSELPAVR